MKTATSSCTYEAPSSSVTNTVKLLDIKQHPEPRERKSKRRVKGAIFIEKHAPTLN